MLQFESTIEAALSNVIIKRIANGWDFKVLRRIRDYKVAGSRASFS